MLYAFTSIITDRSDQRGNNATLLVMLASLTDQRCRRELNLGADASLKIRYSVLSLVNLICAFRFRLRLLSIYSTVQILGKPAYIIIIWYILQRGETIIVICSLVSFLSHPSTLSDRINFVHCRRNHL